MPTTESGPRFEIDVDYYRMPKRAPVTEPEFERASLRWSLPARRAALVLVDVWSEHYVQSHLERGRRITLELIVPLAQTFRRLGAAVVHAPSPGCQGRYGDRLSRVEGTPEGPSPAPPPMLLPDWPPQAFRDKTGPFAGLGRPPEPKDPEFERIIAERSVIPECEPRERDDVVFTGDQLHAVLRHRGAVTLFYAGFAANICVPHRDYGLRAMARRGYDVVLVRDCTTAIEMADTVADEALTAAAVRDVEAFVGYSVDSRALHNGAVDG